MPSWSLTVVVGGLVGTGVGWVKGFGIEGWGGAFGGAGGCGGFLESGKGCWYGDLALVEYGFGFCWGWGSSCFIALNGLIVNEGLGPEGFADKIFVGRG